MKKTFTEQYLIMKRMHYLISIRGTGNPITFARRMGLSRSAFYRYIDDFRNLGAEITYSYIDKTFYFAEKFDF
jgi:ACT domain-containing protein